MVLIVFLLILYLCTSIYLLIFDESYSDRKQPKFIGLGLGLLVSYLVIAILTYVNVSDSEVWNGEITGKSRVDVSCTHSYTCNCRTTTSTDSKGNTTSSTHCDTCYEHNEDYNWRLYTNVRNDIDVERIDRQGVDEPPRYTQANIGDPVAEINTFVNYLKLSDNTLYKKTYNSGMEKYLSILPEYPISVYDYHYLNRVFVYEGSISEGVRKYLDNELANLLKELGQKKQANVILFFTSKYDPLFVESIKYKWTGGKKNDIILVTNVTNSVITNVDVISWTDKEYFKSKISSDLRLMKTFDPKEFMKVLHKDVMKDFSRKHMSDYSYMAYEVSYPTWIYVMCFIIYMSVVVFIILF